MERSVPVRIAHRRVVDRPDGGGEPCEFGKGRTRAAQDELFGDAGRFDPVGIEKREIERTPVRFVFCLGGGAHVEKKRHFFFEKLVGRHVQGRPSVRSGSVYILGVENRRSHVEAGEQSRFGRGRTGRIREERIRAAIDEHARRSDLSPVDRVAQRCFPRGVRHVRRSAQHDEDFRDLRIAARNGMMERIKPLGVARIQLLLVGVEFLDTIEIALKH